MSKDRKLGKQKVKLFAKNRQKQQTVQAFEDFCALRGFVQFQTKGRDVGAALLSRRNAYRLVFGFSCQGIHDTLRPDQVLPTLEKVESGLKELFSGSMLTFHLTSFADDSDRQAELDELIANAPSQELKLILMSEKKRVKELAQSGVRRVKQLNIYCSVTIGGDDPTDADADVIEKMLAKLVTAWERFKGKGEQVERRRFEEMFRNVFERYLLYESLLDAKMGLDIKPLSTDALWRNIYRVFNVGNAPAVPNPIVFDGKHIHERYTSEIDVKSLLVQGEGGQSRVPEADRTWVKVKDRHVGVMTLTSKPAGFANMRSQLRYLWDVMCRPSFIDTEIICQVTAANAALVKTQMQRLIKQSNNAALSAADNRSIDVSASLRTQKTVDATAQIIEGSIPVKVATVFLVHRKSKVKLDEACRQLAESFIQPAKVTREKELAWQYWLQCYPLLAWEKLLGSPYNRQMTYLSNEAPGLMPLTQTRQLSKTGFELIADEGGSPIRIDFVKEHRNIAVFGTTRSGKSVAVSGMMSQFLAHGYPIVCLDYPKPDGTSTFTDYAKFLEPNAAYFDIGRESNNLMEMPNLSGLSAEQKEERFQDYKAFLESALVTMVLPSTEGQVLLEQTIRSLLGRALNRYFKDSAIRERYAAAEAAGYGSAAWDNTPTLHDFIGFCTHENLDLEHKAGPEIEAALGQIKLQLNYWLNSRIGKAIGRPSSFPTDAQLLVFALRNLSNENEAAILSLSAYSAALRRALGSPKSIFFIDESPILFEYQTIAQLIGRLCANGAKAGIEVFLSAQDPDTIMKSESGPKIMQNMNVKMVGRIQAVAIDSFVNLLNYERTIIARNASEAFYPKRSGLYSNWLVDIDGHSIYARYYPGAVQIATVANNPDEQQVRAMKLGQLRGNKLRATYEFAEDYTQAIQNGAGIAKLAEKYQQEANQLRPELAEAPAEQAKVGV
ncbi:hypothetical protein [Halomicronema sp. CCY15110]|uniref:hypothetical protein n=1 Tax=Halomicronema sp. CCY15110 TaxID=2767773 RepID=UPI00194F1187|nr:hypothetical protein [Halomicronema sp. CCY15110]